MTDQEFGATTAAAAEIADRMPLLAVARPEAYSIALAMAVAAQVRAAAWQSGRPVAAHIRAFMHLVEAVQALQQRDQQAGAHR